jgi:hypothetical protein
VDRASSRALILEETLVAKIRFTLALVLAAPAILAAQAPKEIKLKPADAKPAEEFTFIGSVRELSDGRVLVNDPREGRIVVMDLKAGTVAQVGRKGSGPGEYQMAAPVRALAGDSSLVMDMLSRRWLLLNGASIVATLPPDTPIITAMKGFATGVDGRGYVWQTVNPQSFSEQNPTPGTIEFGPKDSNFIVRGNRTTGALDTVAKVRAAVSRQTVTTNAQGKFQSVSNSRPPLSVGEEAVLFPDGWFAIARLEPYRVDWISPDKKVQKGAPLPVPLIKMTSRERDAYIARRDAANAGSKSQLPAQLRADIDALRDQFPESFPPFTNNSLVATEDGHLLLLKPVSADYLDPRYDIVDRRGRLFGVLSLAKGERILAVSKKSIYISWRDEDDIQRLRRHPWMQFDPIKAP